MADVFGWADEQREKRRREFFQLLQRGRDIWTPRHIFNRCCVKWLIQGRIQYDEYGGFYDTPFDRRDGCNGCNRDHPCITLRFDVTTKSTIAHLSHRLDPFVQFLNGLVAEEKAWPQSASEYQVNGYLRPNISLFRQHRHFGGHLVKVEQAELDASDAAHRAELEEQEMNSRAAKRPRKTEEDEEGDLTMEALSIAAMEIVMKHRLMLEVQDDPLTLFCLRRVNKSFKKFAESIASAKVKTLDITVTPLVHGTQRYGESKFDGYDSETFDADCFAEDANIVEYTKREKILLDFQPSETGDGGYEPTNTDAATFSWDTGKLGRTPYDDDYQIDYDEGHSDYDAYHGQMLRVYWHPKDSDPIKSPKRVDIDYCGHQTPKPNIGILIAEFPLSSRYNAGNKTISHSGVKVSFDVLESNVSETEEVDEEEEISEYETDEEAEDGVRRVVKIVEKMAKYIQFSGRIRLIRLKIDFSVIVRLHASQVMKKLYHEYERIKKERPLTTTESEYQKFVGFASKQG